MNSEPPEGAGTESPEERAVVEASDPTLLRVHLNYRGVKSSHELRCPESDVWTEYFSRGSDRLNLLPVREVEYLARFGNRRSRQAAVRQRTAILWLYDRALIRCSVDGRPNSDAPNKVPPFWKLLAMTSFLELVLQQARSLENGGGSQDAEKKEASEMNEENLTPVRLTIVDRETLHFVQPIFEEARAEFDRQEERWLRKSKGKTIRRHCLSFYDRFVARVSGYFENDKPLMEFDDWKDHVPDHIKEAVVMSFRRSGRWQPQAQQSPQGAARG